MKRSKTMALCLLGLSVCGKDPAPTPDKRQGVRAAHQHQEADRSAPRSKEPTRTRDQSPQQEEEAREASSALEHFETDLDTVAETLAPFADGTKDPHAHVEVLKENYEKLYPLDEFLTHHLRDHRDEMPEGTRQAIQKMQAHTSGLNFVLLADQSEGAENPARLKNFVSHTMEAIENIKPVLRDLDVPEASP